MFKLLELGDPKFVASVMGLGADRRDLHGDARMLAPYVAADKWKAYLAFTDTDKGYIVEPILVTPEGDLKHAYNFGGLMGSSELVNSQEHTESLENWARKQGFSSKYTTLIPFFAEKQIELLKSSGITPEFKKNSVIIDLTNQKVRGTTRRMANKAQGNGVTVLSYPPEYIKDFIDIYNFTMDRVEAKDHWRFSSKWFECFVRFVKPCLLLAKFDGKFEAGCLIAYSQQYPVAYYHFAGSYNNHPGIGINHQMVFAACEFVKSIGMQYLYLGGGLTDNKEDGLFIFKSGFSADRLPVYTYKVEYG